MKDELGALRERVMDAVYGDDDVPIVDALLVLEEGVAALWCELPEAHDPASRSIAVRAFARRVEQRIERMLAAEIVSAKLH